MHLTYDLFVPWSGDMVWWSSVYCYLALLLCSPHTPTFFFCHFRAGTRRRRRKSCFCTEIKTSILVSVTMTFLQGHGESERFDMHVFLLYHMFFLCLLVGLPRNLRRSQVEAMGVTLSLCCGLWQTQTLRICFSQPESSLVALVPMAMGVAWEFHPLVFSTTRSLCQT